MDTTTFLKTILPENGIKFVVRIKPRAGKRDATIHIPVADYEEAAERALEEDRKYPSDNVYYAMASYKEVRYKSVKTDDGREFEFPVGRTQDNAHSVKCLWQDWDVGKVSDLNSYADRDEAVAALKHYVHSVGLPAPIIVSSGYGIHTYWVFTEAVDAATWESIAKYQRVIMQHLKVKFDPSRDKDCASILRVPGTFNKKAGKENQPVRVVRGVVNALPAQEYKRLLRKFVEENNLTANVRDDIPAWAVGGESNLTDVEDYPDSFAAIAVEHCRQLQEFKRTGGETEVVWYRYLGLMKHFKDGDQYAHEWGAAYDGYDRETTEAKLSQWEMGPTTCEWFRNNHPEPCSGCEKKCKTPLQLGYTEEPKAPEIPVAKEEDADVEEPGSTVPDHWPQGFGYNKAKDTITRRVQTDDGVFKDIMVATPLWYPVEQICQEDGTFVLRCVMWVRGKPREFLLPAKCTADEKALHSHLASNRIHVMNRPANRDFASLHMIEMLRRRDELNTYRQMGWHNDYQGFLIGDTLITETGERKVELSDKFPADLRNCYGQSGSIEEWTRAVDTLFNRPNGEPYQFIIAMAFGGVLAPLLGYSEWSGIPCAITSDKSGYGKSTVCRIALSIWMKQTRNTVVSNATPKAILGKASTFNNIPVLFDEVTQYLKDPGDQAEIAYALSNGSPRDGMTVNGSLRTAMPSWCGSSMMTGNRNMMQNVVDNKLNPEAVQMRIFEISLDGYPRLSTMDKDSPDYQQYNADHAALAQHIQETCYGVVGVEYVRFIMRNLDGVKRMLRRVSMDLIRNTMGGDATKERFYYHQVTCALVGARIAKKLGLIDFDLDELRAWAVRHVAKLRSAVKEFQNSPDEVFSHMMSDLSGQIIVTRNFDTLDLRQGRGEHHLGRTLRNPVAGRYVIGDSKERSKLFVTIKAVQQWCHEKGLQYSAVRKEFINQGLIRFGTKDVNRETGACTVNIGRGVVDMSAMGVSRCLEFDLSRAEGVTFPVVSASAEVVQLETAKSA